ncbi:hypothetical protein ACFL1X_08395 [Candidatus Hydrogenedentota bacterium]
MRRGLVVALLVIAMGFLGDGQARAETGEYRICVYLGTDPVENEWSGSLDVNDGELVEFAPHLQSNKKKEKTSDLDTQNRKWTAFTQKYLQKERHGAIRFYEKPFPYQLMLRVKGSAKTSVQFKTVQGEFKLTVGDLLKPGKKEFLNGRVEAALWCDTKGVSPEGYECEAPVIAVDSKGKATIVYNAYNNRTDSIMAADYAGSLKTIGEPYMIAKNVGEVFRVAAAYDGDDNLVVVWPQNTSENDYELFARTVGKKIDIAKAISSPHVDLENDIARLTDAPNSDFSVDLAKSPDGTLWLAYQSFEKANSDIMLASYKKGKWSAPVAITSDPANDWQPSVACDSNGNVYVAYDSYRNGNYDVYLFDGKNRETILVASGPRFQAHAAIAVDGDDRAWITWDESGENWGYDWPGAGLGLHQKRSLGVICYKDGKLFETAEKIEANFPHWLSEMHELPQLTIGSDGNPWIFFRHVWGKLGDNYHGNAPSTNVWVMFATTYANGKWSYPIEIPESMGFQDMPSDAAAVGDKLLLAYSRDGRTSTNQRAMVHCSIRTMELPGGQAGKKSLGEVDRPVAEFVRSPMAREKSDKMIDLNGKKLRVFRGDMHRHTCFSADGQGDGSLLDLFRLAIDPAKLDFVTVTDHTYGSREYYWWLTQKYTDLFYIRGTLTPLFAYERSRQWPIGHRNVFELEKGHWWIGVFDDTQEDTKKMWAEFEKREPGTVFSVPHTPATNMGQDWQVNDERFERLVEIYQGARDNYEYEGAPKSPSPDRKQKLRGIENFYKGMVWCGLEKGYKMGFIAASDHISAHVSYANVYAPDGSRESIFRALYGRQTYASTDAIDLEVWMNGSIFMGQEGEIADKPTLSINVKGPKGADKLGEIVFVAIIRDNEVIKTYRSDSSEFKKTFVDENAVLGEHYYYVRAQLRDSALAWSSPIWVNYRK